MPPISDYNASASLNLLLGTIPVGEGMDRDLVNDAIRQLMADLASNSAASGIKTTAGNSIQDNLNGIVRETSYYGSTSTTTLATATLANAISELGVGGTLYNQAPVNLGTDPVTNSAVEIKGAPLYYDRGDGIGDRPQNYWGRDRQVHFGREHLARLYFLLNAGSAIKIGMIGDSNAATYWGPILETKCEELANVTFTNHAVGSTYEAEWLANSGVFATGQPQESNNFTAVMAANYDLLINAYSGTNDPVYGRTVAQALATKRATMAAIRADNNGDFGTLSILQVSAIAQRDGTNGRDPLFQSNFNAGLRQIVQDRTIGAAFFDLNAELADPTPDFDAGGFSGNWIADDVHAVFGHQQVVASLIFDWMVPSGFRGTKIAQVTASSGFTQPASEKMFVAGSGMIVTGGGYLTMTTPATLTVGQSICTVPAGYRPPNRGNGLYLDCYVSGTTWERVDAEVLSTGVVQARKASTVSPTRVYLGGTWTTTAI